MSLFLLNNNNLLINCIIDLLEKACIRLRDNILRILDSTNIKKNWRVLPLFRFKIIMSFYIKRPDNFESYSGE